MEEAKIHIRITADDIPGGGGGGGGGGDPEPDPTPPNPEDPPVPRKAHPAWKPGAIWNRVAKRKRHNKVRFARSRALAKRAAIRRHYHEGRSVYSDYQPAGHHGPRQSMRVGSIAKRRGVSKSLASRVGARAGAAARTVGAAAGLAGAAAGATALAYGAVDSFRAIIPIVEETIKRTMPSLIGDKISKALGRSMDSLQKTRAMVGGTIGAIGTSAGAAKAFAELGIQMDEQQAQQLGQMIGRVEGAKARASAEFSEGGLRDFMRGADMNSAKAITTAATTNVREYFRKGKP